MQKKKSKSDILNRLTRIQNRETPRQWIIDLREELQNILGTSTLGEFDRETIGLLHMYSALFFGMTDGFNGWIQYFPDMSIFICIIMNSIIKLDDILPQNTRLRCNKVVKYTEFSSDIYDPNVSRDLDWSNFIYIEGLKIIEGIAPTRERRITKLCNLVDGFSAVLTYLMEYARGSSNCINVDIYTDIQNLHVTATKIGFSLPITNISCPAPSHTPSSYLYNLNCSTRTLNERPSGTLRGNDSRFDPQNPEVTNWKLELVCKNNNSIRLRIKCKNSTCTSACECPAVKHSETSDCCKQTCSTPTRAPPSSSPSAKCAYCTFKPFGLYLMVRPKNIDSCPTYSKTDTNCIPTCAAPDVGHSSGLHAHPFLARVIRKPVAHADSCSYIGCPSPCSCPRTKQDFERLGNYFTSLVQSFPSFGRYQVLVIKVNGTPFQIGDEIVIWVDQSVADNLPVENGYRALLQGHLRDRQQELNINNCLPVNNKNNENVLYYTFMDANPSDPEYRTHIGSHAWCPYDELIIGS